MNNHPGGFQYGPLSGWEVVISGCICWFGKTFWSFYRFSGEFWKRSDATKCNMYVYLKGEIIYFLSSLKPCKFFIFPRGFFFVFADSGPNSSVRVGMNTQEWNPEMSNLLGIFYCWKFYYNKWIFCGQIAFNRPFEIIRPKKCFLLASF